MRHSLLVALFVLLVARPATAQVPADWQQEVDYTMDITLLADTHQMRGTQTLVYTNNAPDTLRTVYYHLYFNAFNPSSMMAERNRHLPDSDGRIVPRIFNLGPDEVGYHRIESLRQDGQPVPYDVTDTVVRVDLAEPILPGASTTFEMAFRSQVPLQTRRSGRDNDEGIDYSMSQWYPKMAQYDERGWHADPYVGREFYAPYGSFDVRITLPAAYTVGATGLLQNPEAVGHGYDFEGTGTWRPEDLDATADSLTWHFVAEDVHDFAWAADPDYIHERIDPGDGPTYHLLYESDVEERWAPMDRWVPTLIRFYSEEYGPYAYPQFTVAQAGDGGMEYPMVNFLTGERSPMSLLGVTAHEAAHEWFYGAMGMNEADHAWIDEGFTSYATTEGVYHVLGRDNPSHQGSYLSFLAAHERGYFERLNTPADWFITNSAYGTAAYPSGAMVVEMLGYVLSDTVRDAFINELFARHTFRHIDPLTIEKTAEDVSGLRLDWYFEQFLNTDRTLDYALADLEQQRTDDGWQATLSLERKAPMVMPLDIRLTLEDGSTQWINVPLGIMQGHKPVDDTWMVAEPWLWTFPEHTLTVDLPARATAAEIDPKGLTPDRNRLNNTDAFPVEARFLRPPASSNWFDYSVGYRPLAQYADDFGVGGGLQARGSYLFGQFRTKAMVKLWPQVLFSGGDDPELDAPRFDVPPGAPVPDLAFPERESSAWDGIDYALEATHEAALLGPRATASIALTKHLGLMENTLSVTKPLDAPISDGSERLTASIVHQHNGTDRVFGEQRGTVFIVTPSLNTIPVQVPFNPFGQEHMLSARVTYAVADGADRVEVGLELGASLRDRRTVSPLDGPPFDLPGASANRFHLERHEGRYLRRARRTGGLPARPRRRWLGRLQAVPAGRAFGRGAVAQRRVPLAVGGLCQSAGRCPPHGCCPGRARGLPAERHHFVQPWAAGQQPCGGPPHAGGPSASADPRASVAPAGSLLRPRRGVERGRLPGRLPGR